MFSRPPVRRALTAALIVAAGSVLNASAASAQGFSVGPVRIAINADRPSSTVEVRSGDFTSDLLVQATAFIWTEVDESIVRGVDQIASGESENGFAAGLLWEGAQPLVNRGLRGVRSETTTDGSWGSWGRGADTPGRSYGWSGNTRGRGTQNVRARPRLEPSSVRSASARRSALRGLGAADPSLG